MHKISGVNLSAFIYRLCHEDFSSIIETNTVLFNHQNKYSSVFVLMIEE